MRLSFTTATGSG